MHNVYMQGKQAYKRCYTMLHHAHKRRLGHRSARKQARTKNRLNPELTERCTPLQASLQCTMRLAPRELEKIQLHNVSFTQIKHTSSHSKHPKLIMFSACLHCVHCQVGYLAQKRLARGEQLNMPETVALIATQVQEHEL
jgi:Urease, gamma subunit